jgi:hypothetical protein
MVKKINAVIGFQVTCANNQTISYVIDMKNASGSVYVNDGSNYYFLYLFILSYKPFYMMNIVYESAK